MRVLICGKGGSGKSTISTLIAKALQKKGFNVMLIDADESNLGLHRLMGAESPTILMDSLGGKKSFKKSLNNTFSSENNSFFKEKITFNEIMGETVSQANDIKLVAIGKIHESGEGCACPMGVLSKMILSKLVIGDKDVVVIDSSAGVEHFGRGVDTECDLILGVVDPSFDSFLLAEKISKMADNARIDNFFILNKVDDRVADLMNANIDQTKIVAKIPQYDSLFQESLEGKELKTNVTEIEPICELIKTKKNLL